MFQKLKHVLFISLLMFFTACATTHVTEVPQNHLADAMNDCGGSTVGLELTGISGRYAAVVVSENYLITDAYVPFRDAEAVYMPIPIINSESDVRVRLTVVKIDEGSGLALLKGEYDMDCDAILADMREVRVDDPAALTPFEPGTQLGRVIHPYHPFNRPGKLNEVMRLSSEFRSVAAGSGIYGSNGTLLGIKVGPPTVSGQRALALPADRIARFLDKQGVPYKKLNAGLTVFEN
jgi:hypothetical protein